LHERHKLLLHEAIQFRCFTGDVVLANGCVHQRNSVLIRGFSNLVQLVGQ
jgi:hypothetical protein